VIEGILNNEYHTFIQSYGTGLLSSNKTIFLLHIFQDFIENSIVQCTEK